MGDQDLIFLWNQFFQFNSLESIYFNQIRPIEPAVNPTTKKNANSVKSLGIELTIRLI